MHTTSSSRVWVLALITVFGALLTGAAQTPDTARIAKIYNIEKAPAGPVDVRYFRKNECSKENWCQVSSSGEYLKEADWLLTGNVSRADLALMYTESKFKSVLFWQHEKSQSRFEPKPGTCHFKVEKGGFLYAHPHQDHDPGCATIESSDATIHPNGTVLFIASSGKETMVGVLSSNPDNPVRVRHRSSGKEKSVRSGFYARTLETGDIAEGEFSLADFYRLHSLGLGLGPDREDEVYVERQESEIQEILRAIRKETLTALEEQKRSGPQQWVSIATVWGGGNALGSQQSGSQPGTTAGAASQPAPQTPVDPVPAQPAGSSAGYDQVYDSTAGPAVAQPQSGATVTDTVNVNAAQPATGPVIK